VNLLTDRRTYTLLAAGQVGDAVSCAIPTRTVTDCLDDIRVRDFGRNPAAATTLLASDGALTVKGPSVRA
jgi:hypothetical protein